MSREMILIYNMPQKMRSRESKNLKQRELVKRRLSD